MYDIEVRLAPKQSYFLPEEARRYYGRYSREGQTTHWWGDGSGASNHDNIVNYFLREGAKGNKSVNYVVSDKKITLMVGPDNVAWTSQKGNPTTISVEHQPTLGAEGYKKSGWLLWQLEQRYKRRLTIYPHKYWYPTACPGTLSTDRIRQEADKWARGEYGGAPAPAPTPAPAPAPVANLEWVKFPKVQTYIANKQPTNLWNFNQVSWGAFITPVKQFNKGDKIDIYGYVTNHTLKATYLVTQYSFTNKIPNGINVVDLTLLEQPAPPPPPPPSPPPPPETPEWVKNLRDIDNTKYWIREATKLIDITTGKPAEPGLDFKKDAEFEASAVTTAGGKEYRITEYSFKKGIFKGLPVDVLTLTPPGVPDVPPEPNPPTLEERVSALEKLLKTVTDFLDKMFSGWRK